MTSTPGSESVLATTPGTPRVSRRRACRPSSSISFRTIVSAQTATGSASRREHARQSRSGKNLMWLSLAGGSDLGDGLPGDRRSRWADRGPLPAINTTRFGSTVTGGLRGTFCGDSRTWCRSSSRRSTAALACTWRDCTTGLTRFRTRRSTALVLIWPGRRRSER